MANFVSIGAYSATLRVPEFKGLNQYGDGIGADPRYALESVNAYTKEGTLKPFAECELLPAELPAPIETLAHMHRRYYAADDNKDVLIAASSGQLYWGLPDGGEWNKIPLPPEYEREEFQSSQWSCVAYEINPDGSEAPVDVLLMSNALDGMICVRGDTMTTSIVPTPKKFGVITRFAERIWGGAIIDDPDMLVYSAPFDPFNWQQNDEIPEDGAGDILQPSWDGDSFEALVPFGDQLIAFKRNRVWRVYGTNPGEYVFKEQFGGGTNWPATVAVDTYRILMLGNRGLLAYDGESVAPYYQEYAQGVWSRMGSLKHANGCMYRGSYYVAIPLDGSVVNNAVVVYNGDERTFLLRDDVQVETFLPTEDALYFTSSTRPGRLYKWRDDCWDTASGEAKDVRVAPLQWVSPWNDFGYKNMVKGSFTVYLTVECADSVELKVSIQTEKKLKTKALTFMPPEDGKLSKQRRIVFGGNGRRFRLLIESKAKTPWRLIGGIQVEAETDTD